MSKKLLSIAALAGLLASCTAVGVQDDQLSPEELTTPQEVSFGAYLNRGTATKAGSPGALTTDGTGGAVSLQTAGFGVFGYYTNGELYSETTSKPDFMYNERVYYSPGIPGWMYDNIKYWPNEYGDDAASDEVDRLTFFAYAPWVDVTESTGVVEDDGTADYATVGITGMTRNTASGDPYIKFAASLEPAKSVDLCWGVAQDDFTSSVDGTNNAISARYPYIDVIKPKVSDKVAFIFQHALAALNVQIDAAVDEMTPGTNAVDSRTRIYVRSVTFEGFAVKGALNLNSTSTTTAATPPATVATAAPNWMGLSFTDKLSQDPVTIYDGRRDGKEGVSSTTAKNETPASLNPVLVQSAEYTTTLAPGTTYPYASFSATTDGVTKLAVNLFDVTGVASADQLTAPVYVIPTSESMKVTIVYDVETADATLIGLLSDSKTHGSTIENSITKEIVFDNGSGETPLVMDAGKKYTVKLHLGMTSVQFEASVTPWDDTDANLDDTDLPVNA